MASHISMFDHDVTLGVVDGLVGYHLRRAQAIFVSNFSNTFAGTGMRQVLFGVLSVVASNPGINPGNVGRALGIQRANMVSLVNELVEQGLINREIAPEDRRSYSLSLTDEGRSTLNRCLAEIQDNEDSLLGNLSDLERELLVDLLMRIEERDK